ncbi:flagellar assembly peptidoglycan hydrolase FlgJ [Candidatus Pelagadaptatus aseana]|uniref:flagellar assembly peptidoglycan hydrolase FlgJ n=1 Tax=Candidatus Pelagadaptatus aseana TaxID=3120508 RepID=UPI003C6EED3B
MMDQKAGMALQQAQSNYTDLNSLQGIRRLGAKDKDAALEQIAKQFESILMHSMLKSMRQANAVFEKDSIFNSSEMNFHRDMLDHQLALSLSEGKGVGLADALVRQLRRNYGSADQAKNNGELGQLDEPFKAKKYLQEVTSVGIKAPLAETPEEFVKAVMPHAKKAAEELGVNPKILVAQAALETGWGKHVIHNTRGENSFNLFNIKADSRWDGDSVQVRTLEYRNGLPKPEVAAFRRYESYGQSFADYVDFLQSNPRYKDALQKASEPLEYIQGLQDAGYATDPAYAKKITNIFHGKTVNLASL